MTYHNLKEIPHDQITITKLPPALVKDINSFAKSRGLYINDLFQKAVAAYIGEQIGIEGGLLQSRSFPIPIMVSKDIDTPYLLSADGKQKVLIR